MRKLLMLLAGLVAAAAIVVVPAGAITDGELDHPDVVQEELILGEARERREAGRFYGVRAARTGIRRVVLHIRLGEDADAAELAGLAGTVSRRDDERRRDQRPGTTKRGRAVHFHQHEHDGRMAVAVELSVRDRSRRDHDDGGGRHETREKQKELSHNRLPCSCHRPTR